MCVVCTIITNAEPHKTVDRQACTACLTMGLRMRRSSCVGPSSSRSCGSPAYGTHNTECPTVQFIKAQLDPYRT